MGPDVFAAFDDGLAIAEKIGILAEKAREALQAKDAVEV